MTSCHLKPVWSCLYLFSESRDWILGLSHQELLGDSSISAKVWGSCPSAGPPEKPSRWQPPEHSFLHAGAMSFLGSASPVTSVALGDKVLLPWCHASVPPSPFKAIFKISLKDSSRQCQLICLESSSPRGPGKNDGLPHTPRYSTENVWETAGLFHFKMSRFGWS